MCLAATLPQLEQQFVQDDKRDRTHKTQFICDEGKFKLLRQEAFLLSFAIGFLHSYDIHISQLPYSRQSVIENTKDTPQRYKMHSEVQATI